MRLKTFAVILPLILIISIFSISIASASSGQCGTIFCFLENFFSGILTGKSVFGIQQTGCTFSLSWSGSGLLNDVVTDSSGNVYTADYYGGVQKFDSSGNSIHQQPGFDSAHGVAVDLSGNIYVVERGAHKVHKFDSNWNLIGTWSGFSNPMDVAVDSSGNVYVSSQGDGGKIKKFNPAGTLLQTIGFGQLNYPWGVAVDSSGNIYTADHGLSKVWKFDSGGNLLTSWGSEGSADGQFQNPAGIAVDSSGNIYVADYVNSRIQKFDSSGTFLSKLGSGILGTSPGVAIDSSGNLYVADNGNNLIQKFVCEAAPPQPTCSDSIKNQDETDIDCGGTICSACADGKICIANSDCTSNNCVSGICAAVSVAEICTNGIDDDGDSLIDCADPDCSADPACACNVACGDTITSSVTLDCDLNCTGTDGINVGASDVTIDCDGHTITGDGSGNGIDIFQSYTSRITVKNCIIKNFANGIYLYEYSAHDNFINNTISLNGVGIKTRSEGHGNDYAVIRDNFITSNGIGIFQCGMGRGLIYNNLFNQTTDFSCPSWGNSFNIEKTFGTNIVGGPNLGGNYWAKPDGTGFSEGGGACSDWGCSDQSSCEEDCEGTWITCNDLDSDGICDAAYPLPSGIYKDYLPLTLNEAPPAEICTNGIDDDGDSLIDCADPDCSADPACACNVACGDTITQDLTMNCDLNCTGTNGLNVGASDIMIDCDGYTITGDGSGYGIQSSPYYNIITIKNCIITNFARGINIDRSSSVNIINNTIILNSARGISLNQGPRSCIIRDNFILSNGIGLYDGGFMKSPVYNNFFNQTTNYVEGYNNIWNTDLTPGTNIVGGPYIGGNYWAKPDGTGHSETCTNRGDGICNSAYYLGHAFYDYLPLTLNIACTDTDGDGINDDVDNCPYNYNPDQLNIDGTEEGDVCDLCPACTGAGCCEVQASAGENVNSSGATISIEQDSVLEIPANALANDTSISITKGTGSNFEVCLPDAGDCGSVVSVYTMGPPGKLFNQYYTLKLAFDPDQYPECAEGACEIWYNDGTGWRNIFGIPEVKGNFLVIQGNHFTDFAIVRITCRDIDNDGYGQAGLNSQCNYTGIDCNDNNHLINPGASDANCNSIDEDCDNSADDDYPSTPTQCGVDLCYAEGTLSCVDGNVINTCSPLPPVTVYHDSDTDTYGNPLVFQDVCTVPSGYIFRDEDCNDNDNMTNPSANDVCNINHNVINKNCNASDDNQLDCTDFCGDADGDSYVISFAGLPFFNQIICPWVVDEGDCNDGDAAVNPTATEVCDSVDNNCNGKIDEGCPSVNKQDALAILKSLTAYDSKSRDELSKGIKELTESLGNKIANGDKKIVWIDSNHIACRHGFKVFDDEKKAVDHLQKITDSAILPQVNQAISLIISADRLLADTAIKESAFTKQREKAIENFNKAESATDLKHKINYYRKAWKYVNKHCESQKVSCIDEITVISPIGDYVSAIGDEIGVPDTVLTDMYDNKIAIKTNCDKCLRVGDVVKGWTITELVDDGTLEIKCAK